jgi:hypothetical protein
MRTRRRERSMERVGARTYETRMLERMDDGDSFLTDKTPQQIHVLAAFYNRHVSTERVSIIDKDHNVTKFIRVTIVDTKGREYERLDRVVRKYAE